MKFYKYSLIAALALSGALSACSDDVEYSAAAPTPGVFFPVNANISKLTIEPVAGSFDIEVARYGYTEEQTYNFTNNFSENAGFTMPASVTFAAEEMEKTVTVSYDGTTMTPGVYNLKIGFAANQPVNAFGETELNIAVTLPEPVEVLPWNDLGECTYTDPFLTAGFYTYFTKPLTYKVHIEESGETPGVYRIVAPYGTAFAAAMYAAYPDAYDGNPIDDPDFGYDKDNNQYLIINAQDPEKVYIEPQMIAGAISKSHGENMVMNDAGLSIYAGEEPEAGAYGVMKDGIITLPAKTALINVPGANPEKPNAIYYANSSGAVRMIVMPGIVAGDYSAEVEYVGQFNNIATGVVSAIANMTFGEDVAAAKAGIINAQQGTSLVQAIQDGTYNATDVNLSDPTVSLPVYTAGTYTIAVVTYDESGEVQGSATVTFDIDVFSNDDNAWTDLGEAQVVDGWVFGAFAYDPENDGDITEYAYGVEAQESVNVPGLYRFKNVWGAANPVGGASTTSVNTCLYVDASDPEFIVITPQSTGWTYGNFGTVYAFNLEGYVYDLGYDKEFAISKDYISTTIEDDIITVEGPVIWGTGKAFASGYGPYNAGDVSYIQLPKKATEPEQPEEPSSISAKLAKAATGVHRSASVRNNASFTSSFKLSRNGKNTKSINAGADSSLRLN